ncbi:MAG: protein kinase [bacterium]|nr:protein kinase [bacterium]
MNGQLLITADYNQKINGLTAKLERGSGREKLAVYLELLKSFHYGEPRVVLNYGLRAYELAGRLQDGKSEALVRRYLSAGWMALGNYKKALEEALKSYEYFKRAGDETELARSAVYLGEGNLFEGSRDDALMYLMEALIRWEELGDKRQIARALWTMGNYYSGIDEKMEEIQPSRALNFFAQATGLFQKLGDKHGIADAYSSLATYAGKRGNHRESLKLQGKALKLYEEVGDELGRSIALTEIAIDSFYLGERSKGLDYMFRAVKIKEKISDTRGVAYTYMQLATMYINMNNVSKAFEYQEKALKIGRRLGHHDIITRALFKTGNYFSSMRRYDKALEYLEAAWDIARRFQLKYLQADILTGFFSIYAIRGDYKKAYDYRRLFHGVGRQLKNERSQSRMNRIPVLYEVQRREISLRALNKDKEIKELGLSKARMTRNAAVMGSVLALIILGLLFNKYLYLLAFWKKEKTVGQYRIIEKIGAGAMGTVYKARSIVDKSRLSAVKVLNDQLAANENVRKRFKQEGVIIDKLDHRHIVKVMERGSYKKRLFTAMELLEGETLEARLNEDKRLPTSECLDIMGQVADALVLIHGKNIVHRDLKPGNIMLVQEGDNRCYVKLLDFGLARMELQSRLTQSGNLMGTVEYISPEQILNSDTSPYNDIFSMGVISYRMLSGRKPFPGETVIEVMRGIIAGTPDDVSRHVGSVPAGLNRLVMQMMDKDPALRPSAREVRDGVGDIGVNE